MGLVSTFASKFKDIVNRHCPPALLNKKMAPGKEQLISMLTKEGVVIIDEIPCIDISAVILSIGSLPPAVIKKINMLKTGRIKVAWDNSIVNLMTKATDRLIIVAYHEDLELATEIETLGKREDKFVHFNLPKEWTEGNVHFWSIWQSADGVRTSTSAYHGIVSLGEEGNGLQICSNEEENGLQIRSNEVQNSNETVTTEERNGFQIRSISDKRQDNSNDNTVDHSSTDRERKYIQVTSKNTIGKKTEKPLIRSDSSQPNDNNLNYEPRSILEALPPTYKNNEEEILDE